ncbi:MAG TPA: 2-hydroxyglutaryl-CoA dehydratase [Spirochaetes bacterium]|nr:2-hydroxyglutaryl-CoA dehydratase [Spirochaetota bacterium]
MITAGCDIGSLTAKAVIMKDGSVRGEAVVLTGAAPAKSAAAAMEAALKQAGVSMERVDRCVGTGYGRRRAPFAHADESEITCHARGALWQCPAARTVIDIGGQDAKAIRMDGEGRVVRYSYNDRCASGTGRFLEIIAEALNVKLEDMGDLAKKSSGTLSLSNQCVIFAETEIISLVNEGWDVADIVKALHRSVSKRVAALAKGIGLEGDVVMTGGVAKNSGMFEALGEALGLHLLSVDRPQLCGAIGAALIAEETLRNGAAPESDAVIIDEPVR